MPNQNMYGAPQPGGYDTPFPYDEMYGAGAGQATDPRVQRVAGGVRRGESISRERRAIRHKFPWTYYLLAAGESQVDVNLANVNGLSANYTLAGAGTPVRGFHFPNYLSPDGKLDRVFEVVLQNFYLQWPTQMTDQQIASILSIGATGQQIALLSVKIATTEVYVVRLDQLGGGNRFFNGLTMIANPNSGAGTTSLEVAGSISNYGHGENGGRAPVFVNKNIPGIKLEQNTELELRFVLRDGYGAGVVDTDVPLTLIADAMVIAPF